MKFKIQLKPYDCYLSVIIMLDWIVLFAYN